MTKTPNKIQREPLFKNTKNSKTFVKIIFNDIMNVLPKVIFFSLLTYFIVYSICFTSNKILENQERIIKLLTLQNEELILKNKSIDVIKETENYQKKLNDIKWRN
tara:strand:- start:876 stop:1190 length:315 start_codon:yes stop_codon:yes gene_type:complete